MNWPGTGVAAWPSLLTDGPLRGGATPANVVAATRRLVRSAVGSVALALFLTSVLAFPAAAEPLRLAFLNAEMSRKGPGILLADIRAGKDPQVAALVDVVTRVSPDVLVLSGIDYDLEQATLSALADVLAKAGQPYPTRFALRPNTGLATGLDLNGDGYRGGPRDAQGYGEFSGAGGLAVLSRLPVGHGGVRDFSGFLWADLPGALSADPATGRPMDADVAAMQRLSSTAHWEVPVILPGGDALKLLIWHATPPVFDGPEDRNGRRNHDEAAFWTALLDGRLPFAPPHGAYVVMGDANLDPMDGDGLPDAVLALLGDPRLHDPAPGSAGGRAAADPGHKGDPGLDTADYAGNVPDADGRVGPGNLRSDYILPQAGLAVTGSGVFWPAPGSPGADSAALASRHRMVWVDLDIAAGSGTGTNLGARPGADRGTDRGINRGTDRGTNRGTDRGTDRGARPGADHGTAAAIDLGTGP